MTKLEQYIMEISTAKRGDIERVMEQVAAKCDKRTPFIAVLNGLSDMISEQLDEDRVKGLLDTVEGEPGKKGKSPAEQLEEVRILLRDAFFKARVGSEGMTEVYEVTDDGNEIVRHLTGKFKLERMMEYLHNAVKRKLDTVYGGGALNDMVQLWLRDDEDYIEEPAIMLPQHEKGWCLFRPTMEPEKMNISTWQAIFDRMDDPEAFAAWWWGVYSGEYGGRQILYMYGPHGEDAKSTALMVLGDALFGTSLGALSAANFRETRFLNSFFVGKKVVIYPECNNRRILMVEAFKTIANGGSDKVLIEYKGDPHAYFDYLHSRVAIASNFRPEITGDNFSTSRLLLISIDKHEGAKFTKDIYTAQLLKELPGFLQYGKEAYKKRHDNHYKIAVNGAAKEQMDIAIGSFEDEHADLYKKYLKYSAGGKASVSALRTILKTIEKMKPFDVTNFFDYLERSGHPRKRYNKGLFFTDLVLIDGDDDEDDDE